LRYGFLVYMLPTIIGLLSRQSSAAFIALIDLVLGWTGFGWLLCLLWACGPRLSRPRREPATAGSSDQELMSEFLAYNLSRGNWRLR
jgi:hypothetical protein